MRSLERRYKSRARKRGQVGSVEKYRAPEDHEVVGQNDEGECADLSPPSSRPDMISQSAFNHRDNGFDLNSLSVGLSIKADLHQSSVLAGGRFAGRPPLLGWKDRATCK
jgi:hypothetical protein